MTTWGLFSNTEPALQTCPFPGPLAKGSEFCGDFLLLQLAFLGCWVFSSCSGVRETQETCPSWLPRPPAGLRFSVHLLKSSYDCFIYDTQYFELYLAGE